MSTVSKSAALWHQPEARFWPRMKDWVNFHIHKPPLLSNLIICNFRCKEKIKSSVEKNLGGNSSGGGFEAKFKKNNSIVKIFLMEFLLLWCNRKCGWFSWYFGSTSKVSGECFWFIFGILVLLVYCSPRSWKVGGWPPEQLAAVSQQFSGWLEVELEKVEMNW